MKENRRKIIAIDEDLCNGCGDCVSACAEGALKIVGGKAKLIRDDFCDGFGHCLGPCPTGALKIIEREALPFSQDLVKQEKEASQEPPPTQVIPSELSQWPIQLHLVNSSAPFLSGKEIVLLSTCSPVASADIHWRYLRGRNVLMACPKLDRTEPYIPKLVEIFKKHDIPKVIVVRMEVPCCGGLSYMAREALKSTGRDIPLEEHIIGLQGNLLIVKKDEILLT